VEIALLRDEPTAITGSRYRRTLSGLAAGLVLLARLSPADATAVTESEPIPPGVVVESAQRGFVAERGGLRAGDVLVSWSTETGERRGEIVSPLLLSDLEYGELPLGPIVLTGTRAGAPLRVTVSADAVGLGLALRPRFPPALLAVYQRGRDAIEGGRVAEGTSIWHEAAARARAAEGGRSAGCWLLGKAGDAWAIDRQAARAHEAYDEAVSCAEEGDPREVAMVLLWQADQAFELGEPQVTRAALETAFGLLDAHPGSPPLSVMQTLFDLATVQRSRDGARHVIHYMLHLAERHAPDSLLVARVLLQVGLAQQLNGELDTAEGTFTRAAEIADRAGPWSTTWARAQTALGGLAGTRGDLATQEELFRRAADQLLRLQPDSLDAGRALVNMSATTAGRGDMEASARWCRAALRVLERLPTGRAIRAAALNNLGRVALARGDAAEALRAFESVLADVSKATPTTPGVATLERNISEALLLQGDVAGAREHADRALAHAERFTPRSTSMADVLVVRGNLARRDGDWDAAADCYAWTIETLEELGSESLLAAEAYVGLASVARHRGDTLAAERHLRHAVALYESKRGVGRSEEERSLFVSSFHGVYRELTALLVEQGRVREAFEVLEGSRARSLRSMVAARDLRFELDVPPEQERERRALDAAYERARQDLGRLSPNAPAEQAVALRAKMDALHERLLRIDAEISQASPRLAELRDPVTLSATEVAASLGPDTLLVAYSTGTERTIVFALGGDGALEAHLLPVGEAALRDRIARWRTLAQASPPGPRFQAEARALNDLLLGPLRERVRRTRRLVVSADGPLHGLPFAALRDDRGFLAESKAIAFTPSGSFYARQADDRAPRAWSAPAAFGDPLSTARFPPLPGSRREVAFVAAAFPDTRTYLGREASEDKVRALPRAGRFVHFAVHGVADHRAPLDSALVLTGTTRADDGDNGLLHAWEIFERVRLDADLVTLSACDSATGANRPGEGTIGLTRAFLYAGARSVVASLWGVGDASTGPFMQTFYEGWARGESKAEALRRAQVDAIRRGQRPLRWAAFQLFGDDR
jgi:CHAT domain-containing protein